MDKAAQDITFLTKEAGPLPYYISEPYLSSLYTYATWAARRNPKTVIVEIGCHEGISTLIMALALKAQKTAGMIYTIDPAFICPVTIPDVNNPAGILYTHDNTLFTRRAQTLKVAKYIHKTPGFSWEILPNWTRDIDLLYVDGEHTYDGVSRDCQWLRHLALGGHAAFDDWMAPIRQAVIDSVENFTAEGLQFTILHESINPPENNMIITLLCRDF